MSDPTPFGGTMSAPDEIRPPWRTDDLPDMHQADRVEVYVAGALSTMPPFDVYHPHEALPFAKMALAALDSFVPDDADAPIAPTPDPPDLPQPGVRTMDLLADEHRPTERERRRRLRAALSVTEAERDEARAALAEATALLRMAGDDLEDSVIAPHEYTTALMDKIDAFLAARTPSEER